MPKQRTWIVVADAARARAFLLNKSEKTLETMWSHESVAATLASRDIASDRPGRTFDRSGHGRHGMEAPTDPARYEKERFAREVVQKLDDGRKRNAFDILIIVAPPQFLGDMRSTMPVPLQKRISLEVDKDLSKMKPAEICAHLDDDL